MHSGYKPTSRWYSDFWYGLVEIMGALGEVAKLAFDPRKWDWQAIGVITGIILTGFTVAGIILGIAASLHYLGVIL